MEIVRLWLKCEVENILILRESLSMIFLNLEPPLLCGPLARRAGSSEVRAMRWARWREDNNHRLNRISMEWSKYSVAQRLCAMRMGIAMKMIGVWLNAFFCPVFSSSSVASSLHSSSNNDVKACFEIHSVLLVVFCCAQISLHRRILIFLRVYSITHRRMAAPFPSL